MALSWDYEDVPRLVAQLPPPACPQDAERALRRVFHGFARELWREQHEGQSARQVRRELEALRKALGGLSPRATAALYGALEDDLQLLYPYNQAQLVINPCRADVPAARASGAVLLRTVQLATDRALEGMPSRRAGHPGKVSDATRRAIHVLCLVYCRCHGVPYPTWDFFGEEVRNPVSLEFALECLRAWWAPDAEDLAPEDVVRSLHNNRVRNQTQ